MPDETIHEWLRPRLEQLVGEGEARGWNRDAVVATLIDLAESEDFAAPPAPPPPA